MQDLGKLFRPQQGHKQVHKQTGRYQARHRINPAHFFNLRLKALLEVIEQVHHASREGKEGKRQQNEISVHD
jgi:hypothetical protein